MLPYMMIMFMMHDVVDDHVNNDGDVTDHSTSLMTLLFHHISILIPIIKITLRCLYQSYFLCINHYQVW